MVRYANAAKTPKVRARFFICNNRAPSCFVSRALRDVLLLQVNQSHAHHNTLANSVSRCSYATQRLKPRVTFCWQLLPRGSSTTWLCTVTPSVALHRRSRRSGGCSVNKAVTLDLALGLKTCQTCEWIHIRLFPLNPVTYFGLLGLWQNTYIMTSGSIVITDKKQNKVLNTNINSDSQRCLCVCGLWICRFHLESNLQLYMHINTIPWWKVQFKIL